jgi:hypothetical protein
MIETDGKYGKDIKPLITAFLAIATLILVLATTLVVLKRSSRVLEKTSAEFVKAYEGLERVQDASRQRNQALSAIKSQLARKMDTSSSERLIYGKIDEIMTRLKPSDMTITALEKKGGNLSLQYTLKFVNPKFNDVLNSLNYLDYSVFPFAPVNAINVSLAENSGKSVVDYVVNGNILLPERAKP